MKVLLSILTSIALMSSVYAAEDTSLHINVSNTVKKEKTYFLCVTNAGCINLAKTHGEALPLTPGDIKNIFLVNIANRKMYTQALPASCNVTVNDKQALSVSGHVADGANGLYVKDLHCKLVG